MSVVLVDPGSEFSAEFGVVVRDLGGSLRFYLGTLGCEIHGITRNERCRVVALRFGNTVLKLLQWNEPPQVASPTGMAAYGFRYITLHVSDVDLALSVCVADGVETIIPVSVHSANCRMAMVKDPDGNCIELSEGAPWERVDDSEFLELTGPIR